MRLRRFLAASAAIAMITTGTTAIAHAEDVDTPATVEDTNLEDTPAEEESPAEDAPVEDATDSEPVPDEGDDTEEETDNDEPKGLENIGSITVEVVEKAQAVIGLIGAVLSGLVVLFKAFPDLLDPVRNFLKQSGVKL